MAAVTEYRLADGHSIPAVGFGTWRIQGAEETVSSVRSAAEAGYRLFDTAWYYENLEWVGQGLAACGLPRSELFITGKLWPSRMGYDSTLSCCREELKAMGLEYFDLYLIHWPISKDHKEDWESHLEATWRAFLELKRSGLARSIGVSNFQPRHFGPLEAVGEPPVLNQIESHPGYPNAEAAAYSLAHGILPQAWRPLMKGSLDHAPITALAGKYGKTPAQICLRYALDRGLAVLAKSTSPERIRDNLDIFDFSLTAEDLQSLSPLSAIGPMGAHPDDAPF